MVFVGFWYYHCFFLQVKRLRGGAPPQKRKITVADLRARDSDPPAVKEIFAETEFKPSVWLSTLSKEQLTEYLNILEKKRGADHHVMATVDRIPSYATIKADAYYVLF
jgi:hypothetical protein